MPPDLGVVGLGNPLAGDDGVGCWIVEQLAREFPHGWIHDLSTDLLRLQTFAPYPAHIIFVDAVRTQSVPVGTLHHLAEADILRSPSHADAHQLGVAGNLALLLRTDEAFRKTRRQWYLIEIEQIDAPFTLSKGVQQTAEALLANWRTGWASNKSIHSEENRCLSP